MRVYAVLTLTALLAATLSLGACSDTVTVDELDCGGPCPGTVPQGFPDIPVPDDNPITAEKVELGRRLFYDTRLSGNETQACASCHQQELAFTDGLSNAVGSTGEIHPRSSMGLTNIAYNQTLGWADPTLTLLEEQALVPMFGEVPVELGLAGLEDELLQRLRDEPIYQDLFPSAFPDDADPFTLDNVVKAIATFERTLISANAPYDQFWLGGDPSALSESALRGQELFFSERLECFHCHGGFNFAGAFGLGGEELEGPQFFNNALYNTDGVGGYPENNQGLYDFTGDTADIGRFRAPSLRNIELTAPYMHDGSILTLEAVIEHYAAGGRTITEGEYAGDGSASPTKDGFMVGFVLSEQETSDLIAFLLALTDTDFIENPVFSDPW